MTDEPPPAKPKRSRKSKAAIELPADGAPPPPAPKRTTRKWTSRAAIAVPPALELEQLRRLPAYLVAEGYVDALVARGLYSLSPAVAQDLATLPAPTAMLVELFFLRRAVPRSRVEQVIPGDLVAGLVALGVLVAHGDAMSTMELVALPLGGEIVLVPSPRRTPTAYFGDDVAVLLARLHPTRGAALVLGAGPGAVATHIARTARRVLAVDPDPIAHACAELNVAMLGTQNVELRCAAIETELGDEKFDRIAVAPTHPMPIADGPAIEETGPAVLARVLAALPARLLPGGIAQLVGILHGNEDGPALPQLSALAAEHGVRAVVTVPSRQQLAPGSALFEAFSNGLAAARSLDPSVVKRAHHRYLTDRRATHMYLASITLAHSATPGVEVTRHWTRPGGGWQR